jgi:hypothetical protein
MDPDRQDLEMPIRIRIRQNDADPTGSESTTLQKNATIFSFKLRRSILATVPGTFLKTFMVGMCYTFKNFFVRLSL